MTLRAPVVIALLALLVATAAACGTASDPSRPTGVDELTVPTPTPDPADFADVVDNPWLPLVPGDSWTYEVVDTRGTHPLVRTVADGPEIAGVATTALVSTERGERSTDWFAQDRAGNVWWFGRAGEWRAGERGARAGLAVPAHPRVGDGYRTAYAAGVAEDVETVLALDGSVTVPAGAYDGLLVTEVRSPLDPGRTLQRSWARGVGPVEEDAPGRTLLLTRARD